MSNKTKVLYLKNALVICFILFFTLITVVEGKNIKIFAGAVKNFNSNDRIITLKNDKSGEMNFIIDEKAIIKSNTNEDKSINDIKMGDIIVLTYEELDNKYIAKNLTVLSKSASSEKK